MPPDLDLAAVRVAERRRGRAALERRMQLEHALRRGARGGVTWSAQQGRGQEERLGRGGGRRGDRRLVVDEYDRGVRGGRVGAGHERELKRDLERRALLPAPRREVRRDAHLDALRSGRAPTRERRVAQRREGACVAHRLVARVEHVALRDPAPGPVVERCPQVGVHSTDANAQLLGGRGGAGHGRDGGSPDRLLRGSAAVCALASGRVRPGGPADSAGRAAEGSGLDQFCGIRHQTVPLLPELHPAVLSLGAQRPRIRHALLFVELQDHSGEDIVLQLVLTAAARCCCDRQYPRYPSQPAWEPAGRARGRPHPPLNAR